MIRWAIFVLYLLGISSSLADEVLLQPYCKQGNCWHSMIRRISPAHVLASGVLMNFEISTMEAKCGPNEDIVTATCFTSRPNRNDFRTFSPGYVYCSQKTPARIRIDKSSGASQGVVWATFLNPAGAIYGYQESAIAEYMAVCHGWEPAAYDELFKKYVVAVGYKPLFPEPDQRKFSSLTEVVLYLTKGAEAGGAASLLALAGRWYNGDRAACKGQAGESEGLITFDGNRMIGLENECEIRRAVPVGKSIDLSLVCYGEGMRSAGRELIEMVNDNKIKRTIFEGRRKYTYMYTKCP